jgi:hypothetical protein
MHMIYILPIWMDGGSMIYLQIDIHRNVGELTNVYERQETTDSHRVDRMAFID